MRCTGPTNKRNLFRTTHLFLPPWAEGPLLDGRHVINRPRILDWYEFFVGRRLPSPFTPRGEQREYAEQKSYRTKNRTVNALKTGVGIPKTRSTNHRVTWDAGSFKPSTLTHIFEEEVLVYISDGDRAFRRNDCGLSLGELTSRNRVYAVDGRGSIGLFFFAKHFRQGRHPPPPKAPTGTKFFSLPYFPWFFKNVFRSWGAESFLFFSPFSSFLSFGFIGWLVGKNDLFDEKNVITQGGGVKEIVGF